ncbi:hypothetical protein PUV54_03065 [Hyphococcus flavus]|uniref:Secreted protein n=1 Tax=Hyphococcus flavus TaxID=1866326 RepID=A0AAF0CF50_9PROT|nr:hypothetical protein [Hyphococcus flavus]WDI32171.1 hypothetical protein PUV54_03065 [Hyphococcus flavus]
MKTKRKYIAAGVAAAFVSSAAVAGMIQPAPVDVDLATNFAGGDMLSARYAPNKNEFIGCGVRKFDDGAGGATAFGFCQAEDADGERAFCNTDNEDLLDAIEASADYGYVTFSWEPKTQRCTRIGFSNQSFYVPPNVGSNL